jgi:hypothetical protein
MRSLWLAAVLSPVLVGLVLYLFGILFGADRELLNYIVNKTERWPFSIESATTESNPAENKYSKRLAKDDGVKRPNTPTLIRRGPAIIKLYDRPLRRISPQHVDASPIYSPQAPQATETPRARPLSNSKMWVRVTASIVNVRKSPNGSARKRTSYPKDTLLELLERKGSWFLIQEPSSLEKGWIFSKYLADAPPPSMDGKAHNSGEVTPPNGLAARVR